MSEPIHILYVDDYPLDRELVCDALEKEHDGFRVTQATSRADFEARLAEGDYDLVLSDFNILGFEGLQVLDAVRAKNPRVPVIIVTGTGSEEVAVEAMKRGAADYVIKTTRHIQRLPHTIQAVVEKKHMGDERKRTEEALRESESKYRTLVENIPQGIFTKDRDSVYVSCNENFARDLRIRPDQFAGRTDYDFFPSELADKYRADDKRIMETGQTEELEEKYLQAGQEVWVQTIKTPIRQEDGRVIGILGVFWDITERKRAEMEREKLQAQLNQAQKLESVGRLAGGIAHDFNNMLVPIIGYAELGMMQLPPGSELYTHYKRIKNAAERAAGLTRQILAFSRQQVLEMKTLDLNLVISEFVPMLRRLIGEDIALQTRLVDNLPPIKADKGQLEQVLMNLGVNARDAMPDGGKLIIETAYMVLDETYVAKHLGGAQLGPQVLLAVSDTGHGIDAALQEHIFEPFFTTKERGQGTGLGLATVFGIIKQHHGNIWVYSEPDKGTTFKIFLPVADAPVSTEEAVVLNTDTLQGTETVLVVEDEAGVRLLVGETLRAHGYHVLAAGDPLEGLELAATHEGPIDLLLTDVIMPHMNGRELYRQLVLVRPDLKVLYISGYTDNMIAHQGVLDQGGAFLQKPFAIGSLLQKMRAVLG